MKKYIFLISAMVLVLVGGCKKPYEYVKPRITEYSVEPCGTKVVFMCKVNFSGKKYMFVEISKYADFADLHRYEMNQEGEYGFVVEVKDLIFLENYFCRFVAGNPNFEIDTGVIQFKASIPGSVDGIFQ